MNQSIWMDPPWGGNQIPVDPSPGAFVALKLSIRYNEPLLPVHNGGKVGPLIHVQGVGLKFGTYGEKVIWCKSSERKNQGEEAVFFCPDQFPELFAKDTLF